MTVKNCVVRGFNTGIGLDFSNNNILESNTASDNTFGISLFNSNKNNLVNNRVSSNDVGISLHESEDNNLAGNIADGNIDLGISIAAPTGGNNFERNTAINTKGTADYPGTDFSCGDFPNKDLGGNVCGTQSRCESWLTSCP